MKKQDFLRENNINRYGQLMQVLVGRAWDAGHEEGRIAGFAEGAKSVQSKFTDMYTAGSKDATEWMTSAYLACLSVALHRLYGFGAGRCQKVMDKVLDLLSTTLHPSDWAEECARIGVIIDDIDVLMEDNEE